MKIRTNFVSNSSSSSFIVGYGVLKPETQKECIDIVQKYIPYEWAYKIKKVKDLTEDDKYLGFVQFYVDTYKMNPEADILLIEIENNEGDTGNPFYAPPDYESNWHLAQEKDFYSKEQQKIIEILDGSKYIDATQNYNWEIGAERNG